MYVLLKLESTDAHSADHEASAVSDAVQLPLVAVLPEANFESDNDGQTIIYTGHYPEGRPNDDDDE